MIWQILGYTVFAIVVIGFVYFVGKAIFGKVKKAGKRPAGGTGGAAGGSAGDPDDRTVR